MKIVNKQYFVCEICGAASSNEEKIKECQLSHKSLSNDCVIEEIFSKSKEQPRLINVSYPDGSTARFFNNDPKFK